MKNHINTPERTFRIPSIRLSWIHLIAVGAIFMWLKSCNTANQLKSEITSFNEVMNDTIVYWKNKNGETVASKKALEGSKASLEMLLSAMEDSTNQLKRLVGYYKNVASATNVVTETRIDTIEVPYTVPGVEFDVPFEINEKWYSLTGNSTNMGLTIRDLTIPNQQSIVIGDKKSGLFRTEYRIDVVNSNPFVKTTQVDGFNFSEPKKQFAFGIYAGYGVSDSGFSPQVGAGIIWTPIRF